MGQVLHLTPMQVQLSLVLFKYFNAIILVRRMTQMTGNSFLKTPFIGGLQTTMYFTIRWLNLHHSTQCKSKRQTSHQASIIELNLTLLQNELNKLSITQKL